MVPRTAINADFADRAGDAGRFAALARRAAAAATANLSGTMWLNAEARVG